VARRRVAKSDRLRWDQSYFPSAGYKHIAALKNLVGLLAGTPDEKAPSAAGALLAALEGCKQLEYLGMTALPDSDLSGVRKLASLRILQVDTQEGPVKDLSPILETEISELDFEYDQNLHRDFLNKATKLRLLNRIPRDEFLANP